jgi:hypothetical protein
MTTLIFGTDPKSLEEEWREEGLEPMYGSIENDLMVQGWDNYFDPVVKFKEEGLYDKFKTLVHSRTTSGTYYRDVEENEHLEHLQPGDKIDYRPCLTRWEDKQRKNKDCYVLKITCENVQGLKVGDPDGIILGECQLTVVSRYEKLIEVRI